MLNRKILKLAGLVLRFFSIESAKSHLNLKAILGHLNFPAAPIPKPRRERRHIRFRAEAVFFSKQARAGDRQMSPADGCCPELEMSLETSVACAVT
jgi:hypothetical protein